MKILIIEDDPVTLELERELLIEENYEVYSEITGQKGLEEARNLNPDLIILDILLRDITGFDICSRIRAKPEIYGNPFILMITSKDKKEDVISGFERGADDYLKKPFDSEELILRVRSLLRKISKISFKTYKYDNLLIELENGTVKENNKVLKISKKEFDLLVFFVINKGITLTREKLYEDIWNEEYYPDNRTVDVYVRRLKQRIESLESKIESVRGFGYRLKKD